MNITLETFIDGKTIYQEFRAAGGYVTYLSNRYSDEIFYRTFPNENGYSELLEQEFYRINNKVKSYYSLVPCAFESFCQIVWQKPHILLTLIEKCPSLTTKELEVLKQRNGLNSNRKHTFVEMARMRNVTPSAVRAMEANALRKLFKIKKHLEISK